MTGKIKVVLEPEDEGGYSVYAPGLPGCASQGETLDEALANIREAISLYVESLEADGLPLPAGKDVLVKEVEFTV
ncbi:MAG: type II toxin-antitoxin system HicB family antitoxin [Elusimicrobia bacterium]|nr:type II toxin-antitoxin system HicB family antitoxin [Elusimicrobiota bacterium]